MIRSLVLILFLVSSVFGFGQTDTSFSLAIGDIGYEYGTEIVPSNSDFIIVGRRESNPDRQSDGYLLKINKEGEILWSSAIGENGIDSYEGTTVLSSGRIVSVGYTNSYGNLGYQAMYAIHDANGNLLSLQFGQSENWEFARAVTPAIDGGFIITGERFLNNGTTDIWVGMYDQNGQPLWVKSYGNQWNDGGLSVVQMPSGKIMVAGFTSDQSVQYPSLLELNSIGDSITTSTYTVQNSGQWNKVIYTSTHNLVVAGQNSVPGEDWNLLRASFDTNHVEFWSEELGGPDDDKWTSVTELHNGNLGFAGYSFSSIGAGDYDAFYGIFEFDNDFVQLTTQGGTQVDKINSVAAVDLGAILVGSTNSFGNGLDDIYVVRMNQSGVMNGGEETVLDNNYSIQTSNYLMDQESTDEIRLYPNPATDFIHISISGIRENQEIHCQVESIDGRLVRDVSITGGNSYIDISELNPGNYVLKVMYESNLKTLVIQKN